MKYALDYTKSIPRLWSDAFCYDFLDHMLYLAEQKDTPYHIPFCCGLDGYIAKHPYNYNGVRLWMLNHRELAQKIWCTNIYAGRRLLR